MVFSLALSYAMTSREARENVSQPPTRNQAKLQRHSQALRANLLKRKQQRHERADGDVNLAPRPEHLSLNQIKRSQHVDSARPLDS
jgi:hypothetical protein